MPFETLEWEMEFSVNKALCGAHLFATRFMAVAGIALIGMTPLAAQAQSQERGLQSPPLVINNDRGGTLRARLLELAALRRESRPVEIRGNVCFSTCTMFIGLPDACVSPSTTFGFHGPSSYGRPLDTATFNQASEVIASHYPPVLRAWYMEEGRYRINRVYRVSGQNLIDMGVRSC